MKQDEINIGQARKGATAIKKEISSICEDYSFKKQEINVPAELADFSVFESRLKKSLKEIERQSIDDGKVTAIKSEKRTLEELVHSITRQEEPIAKLKKQVSEIVSPEGDHQAITSKIVTIHKQLEGEIKQRDALDTNSKLISDAIASLQLSTKSLCPVCSQKINVDDVLRNLENRAKRTAAEQIQTIAANVSRLATEKLRLEAISEKLTRLTQAIEQEETVQYEAIDQLAKDLEVSIEKKAVMTAAKERLSEFAVETERLEKAESERTQRIQGVREEIEKIKTIIDILSKKAEIGKLKDVFKEDSSQMDDVSKTIDKLEKFQSKLSKIVAAAGKVQTRLASEMICESQKDIEGYYTKLCMHKHYDKMKIEVETKTARSGIVKNSYAIKASSTRGRHETHVASRFSTGQMNCVALSVFFALTRSLPIKLGFMMLDDPSQNLDRDHKSALAEIISALASEGQILISTQDSEFKEMLQHKSKNGKLYEFVGIDTAGPKFN